MTCSDSARPATVDCTRYIQHGSVVAHLCAGVVRIQSARCAELSEVAFLQSVIEHVGLTKDKRAEWLYGSAAQFMIKSTGSDKRYMRGGLWELPEFSHSALALSMKPLSAMYATMLKGDPKRSVHVTSMVLPRNALTKFLRAPNRLFALASFHAASRRPIAPRWPTGGQCH